MKGIFLILSLATYSHLFGAITFPPFQTDAEIDKVVTFLVSDGNFQNPKSGTGVTYVGTTGALNGLRLPMSYYSTVEYWGEYVPTTVINPQGNPLDVIDTYNGNSYTLVPDPNSQGGKLQAERLNTYNGADIYDAACWQIGVALAGEFDLANNQNTLLTIGYDGNIPTSPPPVTGSNRAVSNSTFSYYGNTISKPENAYFYRMVTQNWLSTDPFMGTSYASHITAVNLPPNQDKYKAGIVTWMDWKPITGENAWAFFIGPLHAELLKQKATGADCVPFTSEAVQNALNVLEAFTFMQSPSTGALYYAVKGSLGNTGSQTVDYQVSTENNASALGGLVTFQKVLEDELQNDPNLSSTEKAQVNTALTTIHNLMYGSDGKTGILGYLQNYAWDKTNGIFYQGGMADVPNQPNWTPTIEPKAVDVNTWGVSVLGQPTLDSWFGFGTAYTIWQNVKSWGGFYGPQTELWGVGYSDQDNNGKAGNYQDGIISAEWTAGAINMVRVLITQYTEAETSSKYTPTQQQQAKQFVTSLQVDHDSMVKYLLTLRNDQYAETDAYATTRPKDYNTLVPVSSNQLAFIYASKRYMIPFGWFANPLPSTTSTSWSLMLHYNYNPFSPEGNYEAYSW